jgi:hypothetical protein
MGPMHIFELLIQHQNPLNFESDTTISEEIEGSWLYRDEKSIRIPVSESSYSITQKEYLKAIYGN